MAGKQIYILVAIFYLILVTNKSTANDGKSDEDIVDDTETATFRKLFIQKRIIQLGAIKQLKGYGKEKQAKMLEAMMKKMLEILSSNKITLEASGISQAVGLPADTKVKNALALVLENTCLASEVLLNFPNFMHMFLKQNRDFDSMFRWGLSFTHGLISSSLIDEHTSKLYNLALMELGVLPKEDGYHNPYVVDEEKPIIKLGFADPPKPKIKVKKKLARGPRLSKSEL